MKVFTYLLFIFLFVQCHSSASTLSEAPTSLGDDVREPNPEDPVPLQRTQYRFAVISDLNGSYGSTSYGQAVKSGVDYLSDKQNGIDFTISTGDMVAGQKSGLNYSAMWEAFHTHVTRPLIQSEVPLMPSPGNHDAYISRQTERNHYERSWNGENIPKDLKGMSFVSGVEQNYPFQYAYKVGSALFIALDNTAAQPWKQKTYDWLKQVLTQESQVNLKFIYGHIPLLPFAFKKEREYVARGGVGFLNDIENLFEAHGVDAFFSGHSHVYYPGRRGRKTQFISVPLLGSGSRYIISTQSQNSRSTKGFLVVDFDDQGNWSLKHHNASTYDLISDENFPEEIRLPSSNSSLCRYCTSFPSSHFLEPSRRVIYRRQDL